jgi:hypothetical protein
MLYACATKGARTSVQKSIISFIQITIVIIPANIAIAHKREGGILLNSLKAIQDKLAL